MNNWHDVLAWITFFHAEFIERVQHNKDKHGETVGRTYRIQPANKNLEKIQEHWRQELSQLYLRMFP